jgi:hypothetical protein
VRIVATIVAIVVVAIVIFGIVIYWSFMNSFNRPPAAFPAPITWRSERAVLSADQPIAEGRFNLIEGAASTQNTLVGLNVGIPLVDNSGSFLPGASSPDRSVDPAALLSIATVRLSTSGQAGTESCLAPCELIVRSGFNCVTGTCRLDVAFRLELIGASVPSSASVAVGVSGAIRSTSTQPLPAGLQVEFGVESEGGDGS